MQPVDEETLAWAVREAVVMCGGSSTNLDRRLLVFNFCKQSLGSSRPNETLHYMRRVRGTIKSLRECRQALENYEEARERLATYQRRS